MHRLPKGEKSKSPYFMSVAQNSHHLVDKPETDGVLFLPPPLKTICS